jgi:hypothetical protein
LLFPTHATCPANLNLLHFNHPNNISCSVQFRKHLIMQFSPVACYFLLYHSQIFSSAPYSWILSPYVLHSVWLTKFHTHTKQQAN